MVDAAPGTGDARIKEGGSALRSSRSPCTRREMITTQGVRGPQVEVSSDGRDNMGAQRKQSCPRESGLGLACAGTEESSQVVWGDRLLCEAVSYMAGVPRKGVWLG